MTWGGLAVQPKGARPRSSNSSHQGGTIGGVTETEGRRRSRLRGEITGTTAAQKNGMNISPKSAGRRGKYNSRKTPSPTCKLIKALKGTSGAELLRQERVSSQPSSLLTTPEKTQQTKVSFLQVPLNCVGSQGSRGQVRRWEPHWEHWGGKLQSRAASCTPRPVPDTLLRRSAAQCTDFAS